VGNRVSYIQENTNIEQWHYVNTKENPADLVSRGIFPSELLNNKLWWNGPSWLEGGDLPIGPIPGVPLNTDLEELTQSFSLSTSTKQLWADGTIKKFNSFIKLQRCTVWILRKFKPNLIVHPRTYRFMSVVELDMALNVWVKAVQRENFPQEFKWLESNQESPKGSRLKSLNPFMDTEGFIRVGGRLSQAEDIPEVTKHPLVLPKHNYLVKLIIQEIHERHKHAGPLLMASILSTRFWILGLKPALTRCIKSCIQCQKVTAEVGRQMMGNLPKSRISKARPFLYTGVDYAGPIQVSPTKGRGQHTVKAWIAVFVCFTTKAIHLELVGDYTTDAFLASLKRFVSRRGKPQVMYSDEGTNFKGASNQLSSFQDEMINILENHEIARSLAADGIHWKFNPPGSTPLGGLWEVAVKSMKYHLYRSANSTNLTIEEMMTFLCEIGACLKSRPLTPMSNDPNDLSALTPGHFLIGEPLVGVPGLDLTQTKMNRLDRWETMQQIKTHFWNRWSSEYLHTLQNRPKWLSQEVNFKIGDMVLIKDESMAPLKWKMARIIEVHPGKDEKVRVVSLKIASIRITEPKKGIKNLDRFEFYTSVIKRPIHKLVRLPYDNDEDLDPIESESQASLND